jgi:Holliday junction resolvase RusA-like endonuclease
MIKLIIPGDPTPQARCRIFTRGNKVHSYDPQSALKHELRNIVRDQLDDLH